MEWFGDRSKDILDAKDWKDLKSSLKIETVGLDLLTKSGLPHFYTSGTKITKTKMVEDDVSFRHIS
jgi:hypothetical protein